MAKKIKRKRASNPPIPVRLLGKAEEIFYTHAGDGRPYRHKFGKGVKVYAHADGDALVVKGGRMRVGEYIEH